MNTTILRTFTSIPRTRRTGFTVLELLIVIGIISILIAVVFTSLNSARRHANDERFVSNLKTLSLGLYEYFSICREYPKTMGASETCPALQSQNKTLADIIPQIATYPVNSTTGVGAYTYSAFIDQGSVLGGYSGCTHFHLWVELGEENENLTQQKSNVTTPQSGTQLCTGSGPGLGIQSDKLFDIYK